MAETLRCPRHRGISNIFGVDQNYCSLCGRKLAPNIAPAVKECSCGYTMGSLDSYCARCGKSANAILAWWQSVTDRWSLNRMRRGLGLPKIGKEK